MEHIFNNNPNILEKYLPTIEDINNIDAISILLETKNDKIFAIAHQKYCIIIERDLSKDKKIKEFISLKDDDKERIRTRKN